LALANGSICICKTTERPESTAFAIPGGGKLGIQPDSLIIGLLIASSCLTCFTESIAFGAPNMLPVWLPKCWHCHQQNDECYQDRRS